MLLWCTVGGPWLWLSPPPKWCARLGFFSEMNSAKWNYPLGPPIYLKISSASEVLILYSWTKMAALKPSMLKTPSRSKSWESNYLANESPWELRIKLINFCIAEEFKAWIYNDFDKKSSKSPISNCWLGLVKKLEIFKASRELIPPFY